MGGSPPEDSNDVNIINFISVVPLFVIMVQLIKDVPDNLMANATVSANVEWVAKYAIHNFSPVVSAINIHPV